MSGKYPIDGDIIPPELLLDPEQLLDVLQNLFNGVSPLSGSVIVEYPSSFRARLPFVHAEKSERKYYMRCKLRAEKDRATGNVYVVMSGVT